MSFVKRHRTALTASVVLTVGASALVAIALNSPGYEVRRADLNDGGIWVSSDTDGLFARFNKPAQKFDAGLTFPSVGSADAARQYDVLQEDSAVVSWDKASGFLAPVDVKQRLLLNDRKIPVSSAEQVALHGGTLAVFDPQTGKLWATPVDTAAGLTQSPLTALDPSSKPLATIDAAKGGAAAGTSTASMAIADDGTIFAASTAGKLATIKPIPTKGGGAGGAGGTAGAAFFSGYSKPALSSVPTSLRSLQVSTVGNEVVLFDAVTGTVVLPSGKTASIDADPDAQLASPTSASSPVVIATASALLSIDPNSGETKTLYSGAKGRPAVPTWLANCVHSAWPGTPGIVVHSCDNKAAVNTPRLYKQGSNGQLQQPVFRVNRNAIALNDASLGGVWDLATTAQVDDWPSVNPPPVAANSDKDKNNNESNGKNTDPPKANEDKLGARVGRTSVLHVLDNDSDPRGEILAVKAFTTPDNPDVQLSISPDSQAILITMPAQSSDVHFTYLLTDTSGLTSNPASVTVQARTPDQNEAPTLRPGYVPQTFSVGSGGKLSIPVLGDWRDFDGDPVVLTGAVASAGSVSTTPDGRLNYVAPTSSGTQTITYHVGDGAKQVDGTLSVNVLAAGSKAVAATALPDVVRGQVGQPITLRPLDNDLPGYDPVNTGAGLVLAQQLAQPAGLKVDTDRVSGTVTIVASRAGIYPLTYQAAFGNAPYAQGAIRVDVSDASSAPQAPIAMPDSAITYGQASNNVDALANDFDPSGALMAVTHAEAVNPDQVQVAIVAGRWVRVASLTPVTNGDSQLVHYTVTDGKTSATGEITVTRLPALAQDVPTPQDDQAVVRAGDSALIPVLDNDSDISGAPLSLAPDIQQGASKAGQLPVTRMDGTTADVGTAYVSGLQVRYVAPSAVATPLNVRISYGVQSPSSDPVTGYAYVTINPVPANNAADNPPHPNPIEARVIAGDSVPVVVPTNGVDPDGDAVSIIGITSPPQLGRITKVGAGALIYQAFPSAANAGTDSFTYQVADRFGLTGESTVRIAVIQPGDPQPPAAVDDQITAAPGASLAIDVLKNDLYSADDKVSIQPLAKLNPGTLTGVTLAGPTGGIDLKAPGLTGKPTVVRYALTDGIGTPSTATLTVRSQKDFNNPPIAQDVVAEPVKNATTVKVDVLAKASDPDGDPSKLVVSHVFGVTSPLIAGGVVTVPVVAQRQTIPFEITDQRGGKAIAVIRVPAAGAGAPYGNGKTITMDANKQKNIAVTGYVTDPLGKAMSLTTTDKLAAAPSGGVSLAASDATHLTITSSGGYNGPASITFQVRDGDATDPATQFATITVPVQVGAVTPVLRCPSGVLSAVEGGFSVTMDIASLCHVWVADPATLEGLKFSASWKTAIKDVSIGGSGSHTISVTAAGISKPGASGVLEIGIVGSAAVPSTLNVSVVGAKLPTVAPIKVDGVKAGSTVTLDITGYVTSVLRDARISVVSVVQTGASAGARASVSSGGASVTLAPIGSTAHGSITFALVVTDVTDKARLANGQITLNVLGVPDAPTNVQPDRTVMSHTVQVSWDTPANNGAPIESYLVKYGSGSQTCTSSPCTIVNLQNGTPYTFTVTAHNLVGDSAASAASASAMPNQIPTAVTGFTQSNPQDHTLTLAWTPTVGDFTAVTSYLISWGNGGTATVPASLTTYAPTGLDNDTPYDFTIVAVNLLGPGPVTTIKGQSAGKPSSPDAPSLTPTDVIASNSRAVVVNWVAVDPNGIGSTSYLVTRTVVGSGVLTSLHCADVYATTCTDTGITLDGKSYTYAVTAMNAAAITDPATHTSLPSQPSNVAEAAANPDPLKGFSIAPTGTDGSATLKFDVPASHGKSSTITCNRSDGIVCGPWTNYDTSGQTGIVQQLSGFTNGSATSVTIRDCNGSATATDCDAAVTGTVTTYGPIGNPSIQFSPNPPTGSSVSWTVSVNPNGRPAQVTISNNHGWSSGPLTTGNGPWSYPHTDSNLGTSTTDTISVTVSDSGRQTVQNSASATTPPPQEVAFYSKISNPRYGIPICSGSPYVRADGTNGQAAGQFRENFTMPGGVARISRMSVAVERAYSTMAVNATLQVNGNTRAQAWGSGSNLMDFDFGSVTVSQGDNISIIFDPHATNDGPLVTFYVSNDGGGTSSGVSDCTWIRTNPPLQATGNYSDGRQLVGYIYGWTG